ncbi:Aldo/keto reductase [Irpex rosettiformis]|uniref:Aldo/keto reductase n=1 Tax=Irpex rosettiformis TaxID=378272 RepID=A0ACB8TRJ8_9APHY|nr:Aldo/keto reductase [Irpex rosettiformis]
MAADIPHFTFNNGIKVPAIGLGSLMGAYEMCRNALKNGYRHLDTASVYRNEEEVGKAIRESGIPRSEIFLTTKLWNTDHNKALISDNGRDYSPGLEESPTFIETWKEMEKLLDTGKVKSIGVSNFSIKNLEILLPHVKVVPVTNQVEVHPFYPQFELQKYCEQKGILLTAYSPLGMGSPEFFKDPDFAKVVKAHNTNPGQIAISWLVQRGIPTIPKSANVERQKLNISLVKLTAEDVDTINAVHKKPGQHKSLLTAFAPGGVVFGWSYKQLGWPLDVEGNVID